jgi:hypothetical protein
MPAFVLVLLQGFAIVLSSVVGQWVFGLGIGFVAYTGIAELTNLVRQYVTTSAGGLGSLLAFVQMFKVFTAVNLILSSVAAKFAMQAATGAKRLVFR